MKKEQENCPKCSGENIYFDSRLWICPDCNHEWSEDQVNSLASTESQELVIKDSNGNILNDGDTVSVIKDLKIKGSSSVIKTGTKVKNIRLSPDGHDGHNISCKIEGFGAMNLKSEFVKKV